MKTLAALLLLCLGSCELADTPDCPVIELPPLPPALGGFAGAEGLLLTAVSPEEEYPLGLFPWGGRVEVGLRRGARTAVLAWPLAAGRGGFFRPAGTLYPDSCRDGVLRPAFREGAAALVAARLLRAGALPAGFRYDRLAVELSARAADPWELDVERIANAVARGGMSLHELAVAEKREVLLGVEGGPWKCADPLVPARSAPFSGSFPLGETLFFDGGSFARLFVPRTGPPEWALLGPR